MLKKKNISYIIDTYRIFFIFAVLFIFASLFAPNFFNTFNMTSILKGSSIYTMLAIGMTIVIICGHLDLSIQATMNMGAVLVIGLHTWSGLPWLIAIIISVFAGALIGLVNGVIVTKGKIHSFIATLGTMTLVTGLIFLYTKGGSLSTEGDFALGDWMDMAKIPMLPPRVIITIALVIIFSIILTKTPFGREFYMVGGNRETAWFAGINTDRKVTLAFIMSGVFSALGGALFAISQNSAVPNMGTKGVSPLLVVIAAVIIGGTSMEGGKGGIFKSFVAVMSIMVLFNMLNCFGTGYEVQVFANGMVLAIVVLYEALAIYKNNKLKGIRLSLLKKLKQKIEIKGSSFYNK